MAEVYETDVFQVANPIFAMNLQKKYEGAAVCDQKDAARHILKAVHFSTNTIIGLVAWHR